LVGGGCHLEFLVDTLEAVARRIQAANFVVPDFELLLEIRHLADVSIPPRGILRFELVLSTRVSK